MRAEQQRFDDQLTDDAGAARAERGAQSDFAGATRRLRQQQIDEIHRGDEQQAPTAPIRTQSARRVVSLASHSLDGSMTSRSPC